MLGQSQGFKRKRRNSLGRGPCSRPIRTALLALLSTSQANPLPPTPSSSNAQTQHPGFGRLKEGSENELGVVISPKS